MNATFLLFIILSIIPAGCSGEGGGKIVTGAERTGEYISLIKGRSVAVVANQTTVVGDRHLVDTLISLGVEVKSIFAPEHGFREMADAGAHIAGGVDKATGIRVISLYGSHLKPTPDDLSGIEVVLFDIQDVGARFYTYISTMHYVMEACAEAGIEMIILDRPDPNGFYYDGPLVEPGNHSFVGMHPVPVVHGMTIGEYGTMINGESWLGKNLKCNLKVIEMEGWSHRSLYNLPIRPSPNLPNQNAIYLYPSICFFEGTTLSLGRGTAFPFQVYGSPLLPDKGFSFTPRSIPGALNPPLVNQICYGVDLTNATETGVVPASGIILKWLIDAYNDYPDKGKFFNSYFDRLAGGPGLRQMIISGKSEKEIKESWAEGLKEFGVIRQKYLLYPE